MTSASRYGTLTPDPCTHRSLVVPREFLVSMLDPIRTHISPKFTFLTILFGLVLMTAGIANAGHGPGLVSHWPGDGNANDVHGANPASLVGGAGFGSGQVGTGSFSLPNPSQGNDYVSIPDTPTLHSATDLTVTGWFKVHDLLKSTLWQSVFWKGNTPDCTTGCENREYALFLHNQGSLHLVATPVSRIRIGQLGAATPAGTVAPGQWYHFAAVISSSENRVTLYLNGAQVAGAAFDPSGIRDTTGPLRIGNNPSWDSGFNGLIDGVELYHRVLSVPEISTLAGGAAGVDSFTNGPVSYWPAEDDANDAVDGHHGTLSPLAGFALSQAGMGKAFRLGGPDYVTAPDSPELRLGTNQTVALWYKWDGGGPSDWRRLVGKGASASRNYGLWVHPQANSILFQIYDGSQVCNAQAFPSSDTEWHQLTGTYDGARIRLFYDGVLVRDMPCTMTPPVSSDPLTIGYANAGVAPFHSPFDGLIDDVQIHNVALDNCAILELAGDTCRLVSHWAGEDGPADSVGPNNGTEQSGIAYASGQVGRAFSIDGLDDHILVPSSASLSSYQDFTYSFWIKWLGVTHSGWQQILAKHAPGSDRSLGVWNCRTTAGSTTVKGIHWRTTPGNPGSGCLGPNGENTNFELNQ